MEMDFATSPQLGKFKLKVPGCHTVSGFADSEGESDAMPAQSCERTWKGRMHGRAHRRCGRARLRRFGRSMESFNWVMRVPNFIELHLDKAMLPYYW